MSKLWLESDVAHMRQPLHQDKTVLRDSLHIGQQIPRRLDMEVTEGW